ncbi:MAG: zinc ribbon domain-containing protein [Nitrospirae bacterium]|nr:zinc ribbon domain-containing protein [Nitrospirota bacterium]
MPIYEYLCHDCKKRSSILMLSLRNLAPISCRHCGSSKVDRLLSRFAAPKSEEARLESLTDPGNLGGLDENDPQSVARLMKKMGEEMGEDVGGDMEAMMDQAGDDGDIAGGTDAL